jgi:putative oxidoreductase
MMSATAIHISRNPLRRFVESLLSRLELFPLGLLQLVFRFSIASVFWKSGQSKIASWDTTILLFTNEYRVPLLGTVFVIQTFIYPENWVGHLTWATMLLFLLTRGPGPIFLDRLVKPWVFGDR